METLLWNKIRVLVTDGCNYRCPFCHNEGQAKTSKAKVIRYEDFCRIIDVLSTQKIEELNISGGEPFLHKRLVDMIMYADQHLDCDISCATNLSLISPEQIKQLSNTRVKFNIQFPYVNPISFGRSTGNGCLDTIVNKVSQVHSAGIDIGLNTVIQITSNKTDVEDMIDFALQHELPLKLLPQIGGEDSCTYKEFVFPLLEKYCIEKKIKGTGAIRWRIKNGDKESTILYIDSPCFYKDIDTCKNFSEIRIHPDLVAQPCIMKDETYPIDIQKDSEQIINLLNDIWKNFTSC